MQEENSKSKKQTQKEYQEVKEEYKAKASDAQEQGPLPKVDLSTFILSMSSSVLVQLGEVPEPESGKISTNLDLARHTIDVLGVLEEKTKGNLTTEEENLFKNILFELRMKYVQKAG